MCYNTNTYSGIVYTGALFIRHFGHTETAFRLQLFCIPVFHGVFQHELTALFGGGPEKANVPGPPSRQQGQRDLTHVTLWKVAIANVCIKLAIAVNDIPEDTPPETPKPSSGSVSVCILPGEDLNLHPVNKQDKTLQQSGLMR